MNRQEIYDRVKAHLLAQGKRAMSNTKVCLYRASGGLKCAIGCLIKDKFYSSSLEEQVVSDGPVQEALAKSGIKIESEEDETFLTRLQQIHDTASPRDWGYLLANHAVKYNLKP